MMFASKAQVEGGNTAKSLFRAWHTQMLTRKAARLHQRRVLRTALSTATGRVVLNRGRRKTAMLYDEIRLLKQHFYQWFAVAVADRLVLRQATQVLRVRDATLKARILACWWHRARTVDQLRHQLDAHLQFQKRRSQLTILAQWHTKLRHHTARLVWTDNFRATEELRTWIQQWRQHATMQVTADTHFQKRLARVALARWQATADTRVQLRSALHAWHRLGQQRRNVRFCAGQRLLRQLTALRASTGVLSRAASVFPHVDEGRAPLLAIGLVALCRWRAAHEHVRTLDRTGDAVLVARSHKTLLAWRLQAALHNVARSEPQRQALRTLRSLRRVLRQRQAKQGSLERALFAHYAGRALVLEQRHFSSWEAAFQLAKLNEHCCAQTLQQLQQQKRQRLLHHWKLRTAEHIFAKCQALTGKQHVFTLWRRHATLAGAARKQRITRRTWSAWRRQFDRLRLEGAARQWTRARTRRLVSSWRHRAQFQRHAHHQAADFRFVVRGQRLLRHWRQRVVLLRSVRQSLAAQRTRPRPSHSRIPVAVGKNGPRNSESNSGVVSNAPIGNGPSGQAARQ